MKRKVVILMRNLKMGGAEKVLISFLKNFDREMYDVSLILHTVEGELVKEVPSDVDIKGLVPKENGLFSKIYRATFKRILFYVPKLLEITNRVDSSTVVISFMEGISTHIASIYRKNPKIAWIHTDVSTNPWADSSYRSITQQEHIYNSYDKIVFVSEGGKNGFMSKFPQVNTDKTIIHNVIDSREIQNKSLIVDDNYSEWLRLTDNTFRVISVGRADPVKRFDLLIEAFKNAAESTVMPLSLTIIGYGSYFNNLKDIVDKNNLSNVFLLGMKSNPMPYVKSSDLFVNSSRVESYPTVIGEALVLGVPVLATKNGGSEEILEDGRFGELIENTADVSTLSANVLGAVNNVKDLKSKALSAQSHFSMAKVLSEYTRLIDKVSADRNMLKNE